MLHLAGVTLVLLYVTYCILLYFMQDGMIFPREYAPKVPVASPPDRAVILQRQIAAGQNVEAWYCPALTASREHPAPLVVCFHGNATLIDQQADLIERFRDMGYSVLLPEYRGYGRSAGEPSQDGIREDAGFFLEEVLKRPEVDSDRVIYYGRSIGGGPAADLVNLRKPRALILVSTFSSIAAMARGYWVPTILIKFPFRTDRVVEAFDGPVLICHGDIDSVVPVENGRSLAKLAKRGTYLEVHCDHDDFPGIQPKEIEKYWKDVGVFLNTVASGNRPDIH